MWLVVDHTLTLPPSIELIEEEDLVILLCRDCDWEMFYYCRSVSPQCLEHDAALHADHCSAGQDDE